MIDRLFMLLDFILFCICCGWFLKRHARGVKKDMEQEQMNAIRLREYREGLQQEVHESVQIAEQQARVCQDLSLKVMMWKDSFEKQQERSYKTREAILAQAHEKYLKQMEFRQREVQQQKISKAVMHAVRQQVQEKLSSSRAYEEYNDACLQLLEQRKRSL